MNYYIMRIHRYVLLHFGPCVVPYLNQMPRMKFITFGCKPESKHAVILLLLFAERSQYLFVTNLLRRVVNY